MADPRSPLVYMPLFQGEIKARVVWSHLSQDFWRTSFSLSRDMYSIDSMIRVQVNRFSLRLNYDPRDFSGRRNGADARFTYEALRVGVEADLFTNGRSRVGLDVDFDLHKPIFSIGPNFDQSAVNRDIFIQGARSSGHKPITMGFHVVYNPLTCLMGITPIVEGRARWSIAGSDVTDWEISIGGKSPVTVLGSVALSGGYRNTSMAFPGFLTGSETKLQFNYDSWFAELAYFY